MSGGSGRSGRRLRLARFSALILARKRRIGPFRTTAPDHNRELGVLARAGFPRDVAVRALAMAAEDAEAAIREARS